LIWDAREIFSEETGKASAPSELSRFPISTFAQRDREPSVPAILVPPSAAWIDGTCCEIFRAEREPGFLSRIYRVQPKGTAMKLTAIALAAALVVSGTFAYGQSGAPSGQGSTTGDPAASSENPRASPTTGSSTKPSPSGSGTSTSGGRDANDDQGRDKMPESSQGVRPYEKQNKPDKM